jgi:predicted kinase
MVQFATEDELDRLLDSGNVAAAALEEFGRSLAGIHAQLPVVPADAPWGRAAQVRSILLENLEQCVRASAPYGDASRLDALRRMLSDRIQSTAEWLEERRASGRVRECHGDLHAGNVVRRASRLLAFDCLEFSEAFRWIDVADEVAFLLADLKARGFGTHAHAFLGGYIAHSGDFAACRLLDLYEAHRALVRAKVTALGWADLARGREVDLGLARREYEAHVEVAQAALVPKQPFLALVSGFSGSGKTWLASRLAPGLEAIHLRSDVERKRLAGLPELARTSSRVRQGLYAPETSLRVHQHLAECAEEVMCGGYPAIVDASFIRREDRVRFSKLAARLRVPIHVLQCRAAPDVLRARVSRRHTLGTDASEADLDVLRWQQQHAEPVAPDEGFHVLDVDTTAGDPKPPLHALLAKLRAVPS